MSQPTEIKPLVLPPWQLLVLFVGFPLAYWVNNLMPWSYQFFVKQDHRDQPQIDG